MHTISRGKLLTVLCAGVAAAGAVAGFLVAGRQATSPLPAITVRTVTADSQLKLPVDAYEPSLALQVLVGRAVTKLADACLAAHDVPVPKGFLGFANPPMSAYNNSTVQWLSLASAKQYGFNAPQSPAMRSFEASVWSRGGLLGVNGLQHRALWGTAAHSASAKPIAGPLPAGGCLGQAATAVTAGVASVPVLSAPKGTAGVTGINYFEISSPGLPIEIEEAAADSAQADPRTIAVAAQWHACMAKAGYHYQTPSDALGDPRWAPATATASSQRQSRLTQLAVATTDARCQQQVNFAGTRLAVLAAYQNQLINAHLAQLAAFSREYARVVSNARQIMEGNQP